MNAKLIVEVEGRLIESAVVTMDNIVPAFEVRGFDMTGIENNPRLRPELRGWPTFSGLIGPCWNGDSVRYETAKVHEICSA